jgi:two-component system response regulator RegX3
VHVKRIRARIERTPSAPVMLVTVRGLGYRFES